MHFLPEGALKGAIPDSPIMKETELDSDIYGCSFYRFLFDPFGFDDGLYHQPT